MPHPPARSEMLRPLIVKPRTAQELLDIRPTKYSELVRDGKIRTVLIGGVNMVVYESLERLIETA
jgi:hypothetical protein